MVRIKTKTCGGYKDNIKSVKRTTENAKGYKQNIAMLIQANNITKTYKTSAGVQTMALNGVSFSVDDGEFTAIAGPSGSGKSSLLNIISALDTPSSGEVILNGENLNLMTNTQLCAFRLKTIGFIFQAYNLINTLTAIENVEYPLLLQNVGTKERAKRAQEILDQLGIGKLYNRFPNQLSGGQQQRVAVARAIVTRPQIIMADEPTANLDSKSSATLIELMLQLNKDKGTTFIFSTHDQDIMDRAKRIIHVRDGKIIHE